jgi:hypothetical protein
MTGKKIVIKPYTEKLTTHKLFTVFVKFFIMGEVEIIDVSASSDGLIDFNYLFLIWIYFRFEALSQFPHPLLFVFCTYEAHTTYKKKHEEV